MIHFSITIFHALLICLPFTIFAAGSFWWRPRLWLHSLPPDIIQKASPKTAKEKKQTRYFLLPLFLLILPGLSIASVLYLDATTQMELSFIGATIHLYGIWSFVHLWDFIVIDCAAIQLIDPLHPPIKGTEGAAGWKNYAFHFRSFLKAILMSALFVIPCAFILSLIL